MKVVRFHEEKRRDGDPRDPGLVTSGEGLLDSPEVEVLGTGINSKGPRYAAIARQGNFLLWGFNAPPSEMTPAARDLLSNAAAYIARFREDRPLVPRVCPTRSSLEKRLGRLAEYDAETFDRVARMTFPAGLVDAAGRDVGRYRAWFEEHRPYLHPTGEGGMRFSFAVDEECKRLGIANDAVATLEKAISLLGEEDGRAAGLAILRRYVALPLREEPGPWRAWMAENRPYLFFSEAGGFRWFVDPLAKARGVPTAQLRGPARADGAPPPPAPAAAKKSGPV